MTDDIPLPEEDLVKAAAELEDLKTRGLTEELSNDEIRRLLTLARLVRRTTAGPSKSKAAAGKKKKGALSDDDLSSLLG